MSLQCWELPQGPETHGGESSRERETHVPSSGLTAGCLPSLTSSPSPRASAKSRSKGFFPVKQDGLTALATSLMLTRNQSRKRCCPVLLLRQMQESPCVVARVLDNRLIRWESRQQDGPTGSQAVPQCPCLLVSVSAECSWHPQECSSSGVQLKQNSFRLLLLNVS